MLLEGLEVLQEVLEVLPEVLEVLPEVLEVLPEAMMPLEGMETLAKLFQVRKVVDIKKIKRSIHLERFF